MSALTSLQMLDPSLGMAFTPFGGMAGVISSYSTTLTIDAANDGICVVFEAPRTGDIFDIEFHMQAGFTGTFTVGFCNLIASGARFPANTPVFSHSAAIVNPSSGWQAPSNYIGASGVGSGAKLSVTKGDIVCACFSATAFTSGTGTLSLWNQNSNAAVWFGRPYCGDNNAGAGFAASSDFPFMSLYYDNGSGSKESAATPVHPSIMPWNNTITTLTIDSGNPKMAGLKFSVPVEIAIDGVSVWVDSDVALTPRLVKTGTTTDLLTHGVMDNDQRRGTAACLQTLRFAPVTILPNTVYRMLFENSASATNVGFYSYDVNDNGDLAAAGGGANFQLTQSNTAFASLTGTDATDYTDNNASCPLVALHLAQIHDGVGGAAGGISRARAGSGLGS